MRRYHLDVQVVDKLCLLPPRKFLTVFFPLWKHKQTRKCSCSIVVFGYKVCGDVHHTVACQHLTKWIFSRWTFSFVNKQTCMCLCIRVCRCATFTSFRGCHCHMRTGNPLNSNNEVPVQLIMITWRPCHLTWNDVTSAICSALEIEPSFDVWCVNNSSFLLVSFSFFLRLVKHWRLFVIEM